MWLLTIKYTVYVPPCRVHVHTFTIIQFLRARANNSYNSSCNIVIFYIPFQGFIQKFLFGVEVGVALSRTVGPHEVLHNVILLLNSREMLLTYNIIVHKYMLLPHLSPVSLSLSLSLLFSFLLFFFWGGSWAFWGGSFPPL